MMKQASVIELKALEGSASEAFYVFPLTTYFYQNYATETIVVSRDFWREEFFVQTAAGGQLRYQLGRLRGGGDTGELFCQYLA